MQVPAADWLTPTMGLTAIAFAVAAYALKSFVQTVKELTGIVSDLVTRVAVIERTLAIEETKHGKA